MYVYFVIIYIRVTPSDSEVGVTGQVTFSIVCIHLHAPTCHDYFLNPIRYRNIGTALLKRKAPPDCRLQCPVRWSEKNKPRLMATVENRILNAELVVSCFLDLFNAGHLEGLNSVTEQDAVFSSCFLSTEHPLLPSGHTVNNVSYVGLDNLIKRFELVRMAVPDYCYDAESVDIFDEGMRIEVDMFMTATQIGRVAHPAWDPAVNQVSLDIYKANADPNCDPKLTFDFAPFFQP